MNNLLVALGIITYMCGSTHSFVIPYELQSIIFVLYSDIPTIRKGTDSRIGWGYRFNDRADYQVLIELGPQTNTQPLGNQGSGTNSKRDVQNDFENIEYTENDHEIPNADNGKWLNQWSRNIRYAQNAPNSSKVSTSKAKSGVGISKTNVQSVVPDDSKERREPLNVKSNRTEDGLRERAAINNVTSKLKTTA